MSGHVAESRRQLADALQELKERSGRTYQALAVRSGVARSSLHRYRTGKQVPAEFGVVERIGKACGATRNELVMLHGLWLQANDDGDSVTDRSAAEKVPNSTVTKAPRRTLRWRTPVAVLAAGALLIIGLTASANQSGDQIAVRADRAPQQIYGPSWTDSPQPVPSTFFGVTLNSSTGTMPGFEVGAVRLWDSHARWADVEPNRGQFDWTVLDRLVRGARQAHLPVLYTFGGTPAWASPGGPRGPYPDGSRTAPPDNLGDWADFVGAVARRYAGQIGAYELWAMAGDAVTTQDPFPRWST